MNAKSRASLVASIVCSAVAGCGGSPASPSSPPPPSNPFTIAINSSGIVTPKELTVPQGTRVLFVNNHSRRHDMASDPHPSHDLEGCDGINAVGVLNPDQRRETGNLVTITTCTFHDHDDFENANLKGRIVVR